MSILETLVKKGIIDKDDVDSLTEEARIAGIPVEKLLSQKGITTDDFSSSTLYSKATNSPSQTVSVGDPSIPKKSLGSANVASEVLNYIPEEAALHYKFVPLGVKDSVLEVGVIDPDNIEARDALNFISSRIGLPFKIFVISESDFDKVIAMYKGLSEEVTKALSQFDAVDSKGDAKDKGVSFVVGGGEEGKDGRGSSYESGGDEMETKVIEDAPITKIVATILRYATEGEASDVHIEPMGENVRVRFRMDGVLNTSLVLPFKVHAAVVARIKILSKLRLDERRKPQDGRFSAKIEDRKIDFRVSTFPTYFGEKVVLRILDQEKGVKKLDQLGLSPKNLELIKKAIERPYGLILISGPTGSGKTTTLYSMLNEFNREQKNVLSLEDPVEYNIPGVNQSQVRPEIGYTFANGLRTTLRQDPDIIMVGEIRDAETAGLAIQAALTGHLVLATIHTNNALGVIPRLIDMGIDPYLIAPTLILAIAQRLVSVLCPKTGTSVPVEGSLLKLVEEQFADLPEKFRQELHIGKEMFRAAPSPECPNGTRGRIAVMEVLEMDKDIEAIILKSPTELEIGKVARAKGMLTMKDNAVLKAFEGVVPFEEANAL